MQALQLIAKLFCLDLFIGHDRGKCPKVFDEFRDSPATIEILECLNDCILLGLGTGKAHRLLQILIGNVNGGLHDSKNSENRIPNTVYLIFQKSIFEEEYCQICALPSLVD